MTRSLRKRSLEGPLAATKEASSSVQGTCWSKLSKAKYILYDVTSSSPPSIASGEPIKKRLRSSAAEKANECDEGPSPPAALAQPQPKSPSRSKGKQLRRSQRWRNPSSSNAAAAVVPAASSAGRNDLDDEDDAAVRGAMRVGTRNMTHKEWDETNVDCYCPNRKIECFKVR